MLNYQRVPNSGYNSPLLKHSALSAAWQAEREAPKAGVAPKKMFPLRGEINDK